MFRFARPIFLAGLHLARDVQAGFHWSFVAPEGPVTFRCAAATFYRAYLNGRMVAHGPARAAHGQARVDEIDLTPLLTAGHNHLAVEVAGYNSECYYVTGDASFLQAEVTATAGVLAATGPETHGVRLTQRRPAERFSHARCTGEVYTLDAAYTFWRVDDSASEAHAVEIVAGPRTLLPRGVPLPDLRPHPAERFLGADALCRDPSVNVPPIAPLEHGDYLSFAASLSERPATECAQERTIGPAPVVRLTVWSVHVAAENSVALDFDFGRMRAGFLGIDLEAEKAGTIDLVFVDHLGADGDLHARSGDMNGVIRLHVPAGRTRFTAFEPHCLRYARVIARGIGTLTLHALTVADYAYPDRLTGTFLCDDGDLNRVYEAARLTLRLNTLDVFMDCPGRERAGWLCDALFSGRAMAVLFGDPSVERAMLENFLSAQESEDSPGYFPECYPGKAIRGDNFIPNWSMFLAIELAEYVRRTGDLGLRDAYRSRIERLVAGIEHSANAAGLLERLPGFTFLDWSESNRDEFKYPVSTATNGLYAAMLDAIAELYQRPDWSDRASSLRRALRHRLPAGEAKADSLRPSAGDWIAGPHASEAAQYYLFWTGVADAAGGDRPLWDELLAAYGPDPERATAGELLSPANVFIGLYLRLEMLARAGLTVRLLREIKALFLPMLARGPGTLWEHRRLEGSVCHGFASHAAVWLVRDVLGIGLPNALARTIDFTPDPAGLAWARGSTLVNGHVVHADWTYAPERFAFTATVPPGYTGILRLPPTLRNWRHDARPVVDALRFTGTLTLDLRPVTEHLQ